MSPHTNELGQPIGFPLPDWRVPERPPRTTMVGRYCRVEPLDPARHAEELFAANARDTDGRGWTYLPYGPFADRDTAWLSILDSEWPRLDAAFTRWLDPANFTADGQQRLRLRELTAPP